MRQHILVMAFATLMISTDVLSAFRMHGRQNCLCKGTRNHVNPRNIIHHRVHQKSPMCNRVEIVVRSSISNSSFCLNPYSIVGKMLQEMKHTDPRMRK
ncbi:hypothetical protein UPYG_G00190800 [Umbra pygmaea]|uniref:Chemokine interleukin-8-like domain-containing protein n=1 Tax=Umbra pygmaea TaxID=75934 RepID=A0ABD0XHV1_UMBPY